MTDMEALMGNTGFKVEWQPAGELTPGCQAIVARRETTQRRPAPRRDNAQGRYHARLAYQAWVFSDAAASGEQWSGISAALLRAARPA